VEPLHLPLIKQILRLLFILIKNSTNREDAKNAKEYTNINLSSRPLRLRG
jgi:hypothetical protein